MNDETSARRSAAPEPPDWRLDERETVYRGFNRIDRLRLRHTMFRGGMSRPIERELFVRGHVVAVLPHDLERDTVVLVEQFRPGAIAHPAGPWQVEVIAGMIDAGEAPETAVRREAEEEAGVRLEVLTPISHYFPSPGASTEEVFLYHATADLSAARSGQTFGLDDEDEDIRVRVASVDEAIAMLDEGSVRNAISIIALQWLDRMRQRGVDPGS